MRLSALYLFGAFCLCLVLAGCSGDVDYTPPAGSKEMAITHYSFGKIVVDGTEYTSDIVISPGRNISSWSFDTTSHMIEAGDIEKLVNRDVQTVIIGIGYNSAASFSTSALEFFDRLRAKGIEVFQLSTSKAVKRFNDSPKKGLLAFLHLNC